MSKKRDSAAQRLKLLMEEEKKRKEGSRLIATLSSTVGMLVDPVLNRARALGDGVHLKSSETELRSAFRAFDLDPSLPEDWHRLINYLARSHFGSKRAGAPRKWTFETRMQLLKDFRYVAKNMPIKDMKAIRVQMRIDPSLNGRYAAMTENGLKKQINNTIEWIKSSRQSDRHQAGN